MSPKFFDAHGHLNFVAYKDDRDETILRSLDAGVWMNVVGTQKDTSRSAVGIAERYKEGVYATIGLHPIHTGKSYHDKEELGEEGKEFTSRGEDFDFDYYRTLAQSSKVVAIGECGLDYYRVANDESHTRQEEAFRKQIELAVDVKKPLMLHIRNGVGRSAYSDAYKILADYDTQLTTKKGNIHFFAGSWEEAESFVERGYYFSFGGVLTITHDYDSVVRKLPIERILSETDCPYVTPAPYRGKRNEPIYVIEIVKKIAEIRGEDFEFTQNQLAKNTISFFNLDA